MRTVSNKEIRRIDGRFGCLYCEKSYTARHVLYGHLLKIHQTRVYAEPGRSKSSKYRHRNRTDVEDDNQGDINTEPNLVYSSDEEEHFNCLPVIWEEENFALGNFDPANSQNSDNCEGNDASNVESSLSQGNADDSQGGDENSSQNLCKEYIVNFSETHKFTLDETKISLLLFAEKNCLTQNAICELFSIANLFFPDNDMFETKMREIEKAIGFDRNSLQEYYYCRRCATPKEEEVNICPNNTCTSTDFNHFVTYPLGKQVQQIMENGDMWEKVKAHKRKERTENITDVMDGELYKQHSQEGGFLHSETDNISTTVFIDGMRLFRSSRQGLWTVYMLINEIPQEERFKRRNMCIASIWQGKKKPNFSHFLKILAQDGSYAYEEGFDIIIRGKIIRVKVLFLIFLADLPGRAYIMDMTFYNGAYSCLFCYVKGADGLSTKSFNYSRRVMIHTPRDALRDAISATPNNRVFGFKGFTELFRIPHFTSYSVPIEYMHGELQGVTKTLIHLWFFNRHCTAYIGDQIEAIDTILLTFKPPNCIHRSPRPLSIYNQWKASECRTFLFYYSLPLLKPFMPVEIYEHYAKFVEGVYLLNQQEITPADMDRAEIILEEFVAEFHNHYRDEINRIPLTLNIHNILHLTQSVRHWSNLFNISSFCYESFNGEIGRRISGTGNVMKSIMFTHHVHKKVSQIESSSTGALKELIQKITSGSAVQVYAALACCNLLGKPSEATHQDEQIILESGVYVELNDLVRITRIVKDKVYMDSQMCTAIKAKCTNYIILNETYNDANIVEIHHYIFDKMEEKVYAICRKVTIDDALLDNRALHIGEVHIENNEQYFAIDIRYLDRPVVIMNVRGHMYAAKLANRFETD